MMLSGLAKEFISLLLQLEASSRMSAKTALDHPWQRQGHAFTYRQHAVANNQHSMKDHEATRSVNTYQHAHVTKTLPPKESDSDLELGKNWQHKDDRRASYAHSGGNLLNDQSMNGVNQFNKTKPFLGLEHLQVNWSLFRQGIYQKFLALNNQMKGFLVNDVGSRFLATKTILRGAKFHHFRPSTKDSSS